MSDELKPIDPNHDLVPTLRMMGGLLFDQAADEIDKWRNAYRASVRKPADELWVIGRECVQKHKITSTPIVINGQMHVYTDTQEGAELATLRAQLADALRERDELRAMLDCAEYRLSKWQRPDNNFGACEIYE